jgi:hypothetical protein
VVAPSLSADVVAVPLLLLGLAAVAPEATLEEPSRDGESSD